MGSSGHRHLRLESLPVVDLRLFSQSELLALSVGSSPSSHDDAFLTPKIDRSVFNESAGSRKQTYSRLRLAPNASVAAARRSRAAAAAAPDSLPARDGLRLVPLLQQLFGSDALVPVAAAADPPATLLQLQSLPADSAPEKPKRGRPRKNSFGNVDLRNHPPVTPHTVPYGSAPEKRKRGRPRKIAVGTSFGAVDFRSHAPVPSGSAPEKRKRGRPRKNPIASPGGSGELESASNLTKAAELEGQVVVITEQQQYERVLS